MQSVASIRVRVSVSELFCFVPISDGFQEPGIQPIMTGSVSDTNQIHFASPLTDLFTGDR